MSRIALAAFVLAASFASHAAPASAGDGAGDGYRIASAPDPEPDDPLREAKIADRKKVVALNRAQARSTAARDRARVRARDDANAGAQARYRAAMAAWRRRVAACEGGDWSQCDR